MMETVRDKLEAILRLMESAEKIGSLGEAEAARHMLEKLAKKYKISVDSLRSPVRDFEEFKYRNNQEAALLSTIYRKVRNDWDVEVRVPKYGKRKIFYFEVTPSEAIDIHVLFKFYQKAFEEEIETLLVAFVQKNEIRPKPTKKVNIKELTPEELERQEMLEMMRNGMKRRKDPLTAGYLPHANK